MKKPKPCLLCNGGIIILYWLNIKLIYEVENFRQEHIVKLLSTRDNEYFYKKTTLKSRLEDINHIIFYYKFNNSLMIMIIIPM